MKEIIDLLEDKNCHLEKFYRLNECELLNFAEGNFDNLESFYHSRESLLEMIHKIDKLIEESNTGPIEQVGVSDSDKKLMLEAISYKNELVTRILAQDLQILRSLRRPSRESSRNFRVFVPRERL